MSASRLIVSIAYGLGIFAVGFGTRVWTEPPAVPPKPAFRIVVPQATAASILQCPVSKPGLEEWGRVCRARKRNEDISHMGAKQ